MVASGSFISGPDGGFTAQLVWDGANAFQGDEAYRIVVTPAAAGARRRTTSSTWTIGRRPPRK